VHPENDQCERPDNTEQAIIPIDEAFQSGDDAPPFRPNCSCLLELTPEGPESEEAT
jgi:hypothetical protein